jgi:hypothetical protein
MDPATSKSLGIAAMYQRPSLFLDLTRGNAALALEPRGDPDVLDSAAQREALRALPAAPVQRRDLAPRITVNRRGFAIQQPVPVRPWRRHPLARE